MSAIPAFNLDAPEARLVWRNLKGEDQETPLGGGILFIGRSEGCAIHFVDTTVSRRHAQIHFDGVSYILSDLGSANGTFLNRQRIQAATALQNGDEFRVGRFIFRFEMIALKPQPDLTPEAPVIIEQAPLPQGIPVEEASSISPVESPIPDRVEEAPRSRATIELQEDHPVARPESI